MEGNKKKQSLNVRIKMNFKHFLLSNNNNNIYNGVLGVFWGGLNLGLGYGAYKKWPKNSL